MIKALASVGALSVKDATKGTLCSRTRTGRGVQFCRTPSMITMRRNSGATAKVKGRGPANRIGTPHSRLQRFVYPVFCRISAEIKPHGGNAVKHFSEVFKREFPFVSNSFVKLFQGFEGHSFSHCAAGCRNTQVRFATLGFGCKTALPFVDREISRLLSRNSRCGPIVRTTCGDPINAEGILQPEPRVAKRTLGTIATTQLLAGECQRNPKRGFTKRF